MAIETSPDHYAPIDLNLTETHGIFEPTRPIVGVMIPTQVGTGVQLPETGLTLTPVDVHGSPLRSSSGVLNGTSVLYANTEPDTDTVVKPTTAGVEADTVLRSVDSPKQLYFKLGLPSGAHLQPTPGVPDGPVNVVENGTTVAVISPPTAKDATGVSVPISMSVNGDLLTLTVTARANEDQWPIIVDPELAVTYDLYVGMFSNWTFQANKEANFAHVKGYTKDEQYSVNPLAVGEASEIQYHTQGESKIFELEATTSSLLEHGRAKVQFLYGVTGESGTVENTIEEPSEVKLCPNPGESTCSTSAGHNGNLVWYRVEATGPSAYLFGNLYGTEVFLSQEKGPEASFNEASPTIDTGRANVLYPGQQQAWLSPNSGALEAKAHDPGIGISEWKIKVGTWTQEEAFGDGTNSPCLGLQCNENYSTYITYNPAMPDGEDAVEWEAWDLAGGGLNPQGKKAGLKGKKTQVVKVDGTPPQPIKVSGWNANHEISASSHSLTFEATDGEGTTPSSGVAAINVSVDGGAVTPVPITSCSPGPCTSSGKWTLNAEGLSEGVHRLIVTATDNAGNEYGEELTFDVRHGTPVSIGPGSADPTTGQLKLSANDVSLAGAGAVSRTFESNNLVAGTAGPLGPQWSISMGDGQGLTTLPNGSVVLRSSSGSTTTFSRNEKGEFESPPGDENLKIEAKEKEAGKGITEYLLVETKLGSTTRFTQPEGMSKTTPVYANQFGAETAHLNTPSGIAVDADGNLWVADDGNNRIVKFSPGGAVIGVYGVFGSHRGQFEHPRDVAISPTNGNIYVTDEGNNRIEELNSKGEFVAAFGWGVTNGGAEYQVCTTFYCQAGSAGSGNGQFSQVKGIAIDASGNVWVTDFGNNRVQEFSATGTFIQKFGTAGSGEGQMGGPLGITIAAGALWIVENTNNRVQEFSTSGTYLGKHFGKEGVGNAEFKSPTGIATDLATGNFYIADKANSRVQELTPSGGFVAKFGTAGTGAGQFGEPRALAVSADGNIYVTDWADNRVSEWARPTWLPTLSETSSKSVNTTYAYEAVEVEGKTVIEPTEELAPVPAGVSCGTKPSELKKGCRALTFNYATSTTATGVNPGQWGDYAGHLTRIYFHAWDPAKGEMTEPVVAQYEYDSQGRLRAEWDPRISPALKTTYGYDEGGRVVAVDPPGQEPWLLHYGMLAGDADAGRLLSVTRPAASSTTVLKEQEAMPAPVNTEAPKLSTSSPTVGTTLSASSEGTWSNSPLAYSYQWVRCKEGGTECVEIQGAVNKSYTPQVSDAGYVLEVRVLATNPAGTSVAASATTSVVPLSTPVWSKTFGNTGAETEKLKAPAGVAVDVEGNVWVADYGDNRVDKFSSSGSFIGSYAPDSMWEPLGIFVSPANGDVYVANRGRDRIDELSPSGTLLRAFSSMGSGLGQVNAPDQLAIDPKGNIYVTDVNNDRVDEFSATGTALGSFGAEGTGNGQFKGPTGIAYCNGNLYVVDQLNHRVQEFSVEGKYVSQFGSEGETNGKFEAPSEIACDPAGNDLYVSDKSTLASRVQEFNQFGTFLNSFTGSGETKLTTPIGVAAVRGGAIYVADNGNNRIQKWLPTYSTNNPLPSPPALTSSSVYTVAYHVPLSGSGLPTMTEGEVAKWGQKDDPTEAVGVFPPDKPMGWPAKEYERATLNYMDEEGRAVNVYTPAGGITTTEFNELNEPVRTLSADNRVTALKEAKPAEASEKLDSESKYEGGRLVETLGPEHKAILAVGKEGKHNENATARERVRYFYDEGAPEGKTYNLVTKEIVSALLTTKEEFDKRTTVNSYEGQNDLGWTLRKPTSVVDDPNGLKMTASTRYDPATGNTLESRKGASAASAAFVGEFGNERGGKGKFNYPKGMTVDKKGNIWVADTYNERIQEFSSGGQYIRQFGSYGTGNGQMEEPTDVAVDGSGHVWVVDPGDSRVEEFTETGEYISQFGSSGTGNGQFKSPEGIAVDSKGDIFVVDRGNNRVEEFNAKLEYTAQFGTEGSGNGQFKSPRRVTVDSKNHIWVTDGENCRIEEFNEKLEYLQAFGTYGSGNGQLNEPHGIALDGSGHVWVADENNNRVEEFSETGEYISQFGSHGTGNGQFVEEEALGLAAEGDIWVLDTGNERLEKLSSTGTYITQFGSDGGPEEPMDAPKGVALDSNDNVWVADTYNDRIEEFSKAGEFIQKFGSAGTENGQFKWPRAIAVDSKGNIWVADQDNNRVQEFDSTGKFIRAFGEWGTGTGQFKEPQGITTDASGHVWVSDTLNDRVEEFSETGAFIQQFGSAGSEHGHLNEPHGLAVDASGDIWVANSNNGRIDEFNNKGEYVNSIGKWGSKEGEFAWPLDVKLDANGRLWVADANNSRIQELTSSGVVLGSFGSYGSGGGQMNEPRALAVDSQGDAWVADSNNNRVERWTVATPGDTATVYYSTEANTMFPSCGEHPEWANLPCETVRGAQPEPSARPGLPVSTVTYNVWDEVLVTTESFPATSKFAAVTRTDTQTYDAAGRALTSETKSTNGTHLYQVKNVYNTESGILEKQSWRELGVSFETITSTYNTLGQLATYQDADSNVTSYTYDIDGRVGEISDPKGKQSYVYDPTTGLLTKLVDSGAGTFTATYDAEGKMLTDVFPDGLTAKYAYNAAGSATALEYEKKTHCEKTCPEMWFSDAATPSIHGETLTQASTLSSESYSYDNIGRPVETLEIPVGKGCKARLYSHDEESNRLSETNRESSSETCPSEGGTVETHTYDSANRLADAGISYEAFGNTTELPATDAGGYKLTSTFYVDGQVATQNQHEETIEYLYDPVGRVRETISKGTTNSTAITHYAGPGEALSWVNEGGEKWSRNIPGIDGALAAIQSSSGTTVLQLHDLQGDVVGTAGTSEAETKPQSTFDSTEFGVPVGGKTPAKYAWLGASGVKTEFETGISTESGTSYVPQIGRPVQTAQVVPPGAFPNGSGSGSPYTAEIPGWSTAVAEQESAQTLAEWAAEQEALAAAEGGNNPESGGGIDPEGIMSGKEATEFGHQLDKEEKSLEVWSSQEICENALNPSACELLVEEGEKNDDDFADQLLECGHQTKNGDWIIWDKRRYFRTRVCYADFEFELYEDDRVIFDHYLTRICFSFPWTKHGSQEWECELPHGVFAWFNFNHRGWWKKK